jgi:flagellar basal body-associated protein FliL
MDKKKNHLIVFIVVVVVILIIALLAYFYAKDHPTGDILGAESAERGKPEEATPPEVNVVDPEINNNINEELIT